MSTFSKEHFLFIKRKKHKKYFIFFCQIIILIIFIFGWQYLANNKIINTFLFSSPLKVYKCFIELYKNSKLLSHISVTIYETLISFVLANVIGLITATILWWSKTVAKIMDPYLTIINSLPKVALGPLIIIWVGASINSIIAMALMISAIISIINIYNAFNSTEKSFITLMKTFKSSKWQIYKKVIIPYNILNIINTFKINISMSLIGLLPPVGEKVIIINKYCNIYLFHYH